ncbi:hypothetical protein M0811_01329 [Anaeramoeba ignava]|uniref:Uncharacterized protein n=1 Tax=Anaeramoeba ignava TaxID=1746090 RepID=A0A9Q0LI82_ANAIG|nr:hypothetical protein M0811_01329 [Anaeramoeba ignava]
MEKQTLRQAKLFYNSFIILDSKEEGTKILLTKDEYLSGLSDFERSAKLQTSRPVSSEELMEFQAKQVIEWNEKEKENWENIIEELRTEFEKYEALTIPEQIFLVKTTGKDEGEAAYCRGMNGIFYPQSMDIKKSTLAHELWHIISRNMPTEKRDEIYSIFGFHSFGTPIDYPHQLLEYKISNPDAVNISHYLPIDLNATDSINITPIMYSKSKIFNPSFGQTFFNYLELGFLIVHKNDKNEWVPKLKPNSDENDFNSLELIPPQELPFQFWEKIGTNTNYIHHNEEITAENFMMMIVKDEPRTPKLIENLAKALKKKD